MRTRIVNGVRIPFTDEENAARDAEEAQWASEAPQREAARRARSAELQLTPLLLARCMQQLVSEAGITPAEGSPLSILNSLMQDGGLDI